MKISLQKLALVLFSLLFTITLSGCESAKLIGENSGTATDAISSATEASDADSKIKVVWESLSDEAVSLLFKDDQQTGVFIWSNANENLVVGDPNQIPIPFSWPPERSVVSAESLGYALVKAEPKALIDVDPDYILLLMPKGDEGRLETVGLALKEALAGKALAKVKRDHFYVWFYEPKVK